MYIKTLFLKFNLAVLNSFKKRNSQNVAGKSFVENYLETVPFNQILHTWDLSTWMLYAQTIMHYIILSVYNNHVNKFHRTFFFFNSGKILC